MTAINVHDETYHDLVIDILQHANRVDKELERTGTGTIKVFGRQMRFNLTKGFPLLTTKKMAWKGIVSELLWFIEGSGNERRLAEIRYGKDREELAGRETIWTANANDPNWLPKAQCEGDMGRIYGVQWRNWATPIYQDGKIDGFRYVDQLTQVIEGIKKNPYGRRHILQAWNPGEIDNMALPPCHMVVQFDVSPQGLSCHAYLRSQDVFLGSPFNIASYALFTMMVAQVCGLEAYELIITTGDTHIYMNHLEQMAEQIERVSFPPPTVVLDQTITNIDGFTMDSIQLIGYQSHDAIKGVMAV